MSDSGYTPYSAIHILHLCTHTPSERTSAPSLLQISQGRSQAGGEAEPDLFSLTEREAAVAPDAVSC